MLYYKIEATVEGMPKNITTKKGMLKFFGTPKALTYKYEAFALQMNNEFYLCFSELAENRLTLACISKTTQLSYIKRQLPAFFLQFKLSAHVENSEEITFKDIDHLLDMAENSFIQNRFDIYDYIDINRNFYRHGFRFFRSREWICAENKSKAKLLLGAKELLCDSTLLAEIQRIYTPPPQKNVFGHPVHYVIACDSVEKTKKIIEILVSALYKNGRLQSRRYCFMPTKNCSEGYLGEQDTYYSLCEGGSMAVELCIEQNDGRGVSHYGDDFLEKFCTMMKKHKNKTLTIFCTKRLNDTAKKQLYQNLGGVSLIEIQEDVLFGKDAQSYLNRLAKDHSISPDEALLSTLQDTEKGFLPNDVYNAFQSWYSKKLKTELYPQYSKIVDAFCDEGVKKPRGSAYVTLQEMVGLSAAKATIQKALDYYKAQKLFADMGMQKNSPAMHMVFTGNPGTAKTSVARLFAQILKENEVLTKGDLHEVGRAELVGKYVGWTAKIVKEKFEDAIGSVLFIDEAYSLCDGKEGLYGDEAINTIVQEMENNRENMVVIFAGYPDEMEQFLQRNPGLRSRIAFHVHFEDYTPKELFDITELLARQKELCLGQGVREKLLPVFEAACHSPDFGGGRFGRNLLEAAMMNQASRLVSSDVAAVTQKDVETLLAEDFEVPQSVGEKRGKVIGF